MSPGAKKNFEWKVLIGIVWMVFNLSLAIWWMIFSLRNIEASTPHHQMLISEGAILILSLLLGGAALLYYIARERKRNDQIRQFFGTFSHELKTSIASLRLQAESLAEDFKESASTPLFQRLVKDTVRLEIQLENSLSLAQLESNRLFIEKLSLKRLLSSLEHQWPDFKIELTNDAEVLADKRALESVLRNLIQNAIVHGGAKRMRIAVVPASVDRLELRLEDDGQGFAGDRSNLGRLFLRHNAKSGSGVGLFLVRTLVEKMGGSVEFPPVPQGFATVLRLRAAGGGA